MMNDPLLPPPPPSPTARRSTRRPGVANSAKILATGLATTATLGLTTGYALASKSSPDNTQTGNNTSQPATLMAPVNPTVETPVTNDTSSIAPDITSPPVVEIPVPTIAPAQPGNNWGDAGNNQTSNGSR